MDSVNFLTIEEGDDLILAFSFDEGTRYGIEGYIIQRTPKFEMTLLPEEIGPSVDWTDEDGRIVLTSVNVNRNQILIETTLDQQSFNISKISNNEYLEMTSILKKMNFDNIFDLKIEK